jgi:hypothetical protein
MKQHDDDAVFALLARLTSLTSLELGPLLLGILEEEVQFALHALPPNLVELRLTILHHTRQERGDEDDPEAAIAAAAVAEQPYNLPLFAVRERLIVISDPERIAGLGLRGAPRPRLCLDSLRRLCISYHMQYFDFLRGVDSRDDFDATTALMHLCLSEKSLPCVFPALEEFEFGVDSRGGPVGHRADVAALLESETVKRVTLRNVGEVDRGTREAARRRGGRVRRERGGGAVVIELPPGPSPNAVRTL